MHCVYIESNFGLIYLNITLCHFNFCHMVYRALEYVYDDFLLSYDLLTDNTKCMYLYTIIFIFS